MNQNTELIEHLKEQLFMAEQFADRIELTKSQTKEIISALEAVEKQERHIFKPDPKNNRFCIICGCYLTDIKHERITT